MGPEESVASSSSYRDRVTAAADRHPESGRGLKGGLPSFVRLGNTAAVESYMRSTGGIALLGAIEVLSERAVAKTGQDGPWEGIDVLKGMRKRRTAEGTTSPCPRTYLEVQRGKNQSRTTNSRSASSLKKASSHQSMSKEMQP